MRRETSSLHVRVMFVILAVGLAGALLAVTACQAPDTSVEWAIPVPSGTRLITLPPVALESRMGPSIALVEDLVLGRQEGGEDTPLFARVTDLEVDRNGRLFAYDRGNFAVHVFDAEGRFVYSIGGAAGAGPQDFGRYGEIAVVGGDKLAYFRSDGALLSLWQGDGEHISTIRFGFNPFIGRMVGTEANGDLVASFVETDDTGTKRVVARFALNGDEVVRYLTVPDESQVVFVRQEAGDYLEVATGISLGIPTFAVGRQGEVYVTRGSEYQVHALTADGTPTWALAVRWPRAPLVEADIDGAMQVVRRLVPDAQSDEIDWPQYMPALHSRAIQVDGHGHIYVFPYSPERADPTGTTESVHPVDVYSADGRQLYTGRISPRVMWLAAFGDCVYAVREAESTGEEEIVRYRLNEPF